MTEIVIDTNVFVHAHNNAAPEHDDAKFLCSLIRGAETVLCVDDGFSLNETQNNSRIGREYLDHLRSGTIGFETVALLARTGRVRFVTSKIAASEARWLNQKIPHNPTDRIFVRVTYNTADRLFVSHDRHDFPDEVRESLRARWSLRVVGADGACADL